MTAASPTLTSRLAPQSVVESLVGMATLRRQVSTHSTATGTSLSNKQTAATSRPFTGRTRPRTAVTATVVGENEIICAISESRGISPTIGLSFVNLSTSEAVLCQFTDTQTYARTCHKLKVFSPSEIIYMKTAADSKLLSIIRENLEVEKFGILMKEADRRYWSDTTGHEYVHQLAFPDDLESLKMTIGGNYFAACCFAAVGGIRVNIAIADSSRLSSTLSLFSYTHSPITHCASNLKLPKGL